jgi:hypothetical protein
MLGLNYTFAQESAPQPTHNQRGPRGVITSETGNVLTSASQVDGWLDERLLRLHLWR